MQIIRTLKLMLKLNTTEKEISEKYRHFQKHTVAFLYI